MIKINQLYIKVNTADESFEFRDTFSDKLNVITSYSNTKGKSTIGEAILFCLGLEEILGNRNERAIKPVLRSLIEKEGEEKTVIQSDIFLEIENTDKKIITIQRSPVHNNRNVKLVSVYENLLEEVTSKECTFTDYFVHDGGAAKNIRGFHAFLERFIGYNLPSVSTYEGSTVSLYIQTVVSCFYIEQKKGWMNILATMPTYFKIKEPKRRVLEYVLGLSVLETEKKYNLAKAKLKETETEWKILCHSIISRLQKKGGFNVEGLQEKPYIIPENQNLVIYLMNEDNKVRIEKIIDEIDINIGELNNISEPIIENRHEALNRELHELNQLLENFSLKLIEAHSEYALEKEQIESIQIRIDSIRKDLGENKDLKKLIQLGSLENTSIAKSKCPTCGQKIDDTLFEQSGDLKIMTIDESINYLNNEKSMLEFSYIAQLDLVRSKEELINKLENRIESISDRIRFVKSDLISNNKAISQSHINQIVSLEIEKKSIMELESDVNELWTKLIATGKQWGIDKENFSKLPSNFINDNDKRILKEFNEEFKRLLAIFKFESTTISNICIDEYNYLPSVDGFDLYADSSASDTIRIMWAYIIALQKISMLHGNNFGFLLFDEPAQQNADISSAKELMKELLKLSESQQVFVLYKMEKTDGLLDELPNESFKRIHADKHIISCVKPKQELK